MDMFDPFEAAKTKYLFFTGKGGVGKTSAACAAAVSLADQGKKVLLDGVIVITGRYPSNKEFVKLLELPNGVLNVEQH